MMDDLKSSPEKMPPPPPPDDEEDDESAPQDKIEIERAEEQKLRAKFSQINRAPGAGGGGGHSSFLQKRLAKGQKYFDSGDYQMAKQKPRVGGGPSANRTNLAIPVLSSPSTGDTIPTPDSVPARKTSIIQPIHDASRSMHMPSDPAHLGINPTPVPPAPGQPLPNPAIAKLASWVWSLRYTIFIHPWRIYNWL